MRIYCDIITSTSLRILTASTEGWFRTLIQMKRIILILLFPIILAACGNSRAEEALQAYEKKADELVEARAQCNYKRQMEIAVELRALSAEYADIKADRDLNDEQRKRLGEAMKKIMSGGYQEMIENMTAPYKPTE